MLPWAWLLGWGFDGLEAESYLTARLLFGLTLPGVSAHRFLKGAGQNIIHLIYTQRESERERVHIMLSRSAGAGLMLNFIIQS